MRYRRETNSNNQSVKRKLEDISPSSSVHKTGFMNLEWKRCAEGFEDFHNVNKTDAKEDSKHWKKGTPSRGSAFSFGTGFDDVTQAQDALQQTDSPMDDISWNSTDSDNEQWEQVTHEERVDSHRTSAKRKLTLPKPNLSQHKAKKSKTMFGRNKTLRKGLVPCWREEKCDEDISISSSESEEEDTSMQFLKADNSVLFPHITKSSANSPVIQSCQSSQSTSSTSPSTGMKASDWIKNVQWQTTPVKRNVTEDDTSVDPDSAKKKKLTFKKGGFAEQLSRVQSREKSSIRMWSHEQDETSSSPASSSKVLFVRVERFEILFSLQIAHCLVAEGDSEEISTKRDKWRNTLVLFSCQQMEQLYIQEGSLLQLHPPWQQLDGLNGDLSVLLCTYYTKVITHPDSTVAHSEHRETKDNYLKWSCPCLSDLRTDLKTCPAHEFPAMPSTLKYEKSTAECDPGSTALHTVTANQKPAPVRSKSLLEAIELAGSHSLRCLCFRAIVHRIFCYHDSQTKRYSLLVEDNHGTFAVVAVPSNHDDEELWKLEGKSVCLSGLLLDSRRNRDQEPNLFSVIDIVWSGVNTSESSQESEVSEETSSSHKQHTSLTPPGFCYFLKSDDSFFFDTSPDRSSSYKTPEHTCLKNISQCDCLTRKSFLAKLIFQYTENEHSVFQSQSSRSDPSLPSKGRQLLYITDNSLQEESSAYLTIAISSNQCVTVVPDSSMSLAFFKDVLIEEDKCQIDCYSDIIDILSERNAVNDIPVKTVEQLRCLHVRLPEISDTSTEHSLVSVTGHIADINEEACYSWEACDQCQGDRLTTRPHSQGLFCVTCEKMVPSPVTGLKMEVYIQTPQLNPDSKLQVNLGQSTIKRLLPQKPQEEVTVDNVLQ